MYKENFVTFLLSILLSFNFFLILQLHPASFFFSTFFFFSSSFISRAIFFLPFIVLHNSLCSSSYPYFSFLLCRLSLFDFSLWCYCVIDHHLLSLNRFYPFFFLFRSLSCISSPSSFPPPPPPHTHTRVPN